MTSYNPFSSDDWTPNTVPLSSHAAYVTRFASNSPGHCHTVLTHSCFTVFRATASTPLVLGPDSVGLDDAPFPIASIPLVGVSLPKRPPSTPARADAMLAKKRRVGNCADDAVSSSYVDPGYMDATPSDASYFGFGVGTDSAFSSRYFPSPATPNIAGCSTHSRYTINGASAFISPSNTGKHASRMLLPPASSPVSEPLAGSECFESVRGRCAASLW